MRALAAASLVICAVQSVRLTNRGTPKPLSRAAGPVAPRSFSNDVQRRILEAAEGAHIDSLKSVEVRSSGNGLRVEWQGGAVPGLEFMRRSETQGIAAVHLRVNPGRWVMEARPAAPRPSVPLSTEFRDPFETRPRPSPPAPSDVRRKREKSERARREREQREQAAAAAAEDARRIEQRKSELSGALTLSALLNNGREPVALVEIVEAGRRRTVTLRRGETVMGARVAEIDEKSRCVQLEIDEHSRVTLTLSGGRRP